MSQEQYGLPAEAIACYTYHNGGFQSYHARVDKDQYIGFDFSYDAMRDMDDVSGYEEAMKMPRGLSIYEPLKVDKSYGMFWKCKSMVNFTRPHLISRMAAETTLHGQLDNDSFSRLLYLYLQEKYHHSPRLDVQHDQVQRYRPDQREYWRHHDRQ